jgi:uncharacterized protein YkwD
VRRSGAKTIAVIAACGALLAAVPAGASAASHLRHRGYTLVRAQSRHAGARVRHHSSHASRLHRRSHAACSRAGHIIDRSPSHACVASLRKSSPAAARRRHHAAVRLSNSEQRSAQRAAAIARALATPCENTQITPEPSNLEAARAAVLCLINRERAQNGELPLTVDSRLQTAAEGHAQECVSANYFAHVSPSGVTPVDRIRATGYIPGPEFGYVIGENLAWGTLSLSTPQAIVEAWMASPDHRANILESRYVDTGVGIAPAVPASLSGGSPGATYAQEFGTLIS